MKLKPGDRVVRLPEYAQNWPDPVATVRTVNYEILPPQITLEEHGSNMHFHVEYFELESIYNSPLNKALR